MRLYLARGLNLTAKQWKTSGTRIGYKLALAVLIVAVRRQAGKGEALIPGSVQADQGCLSTSLQGGGVSIRGL